MVDIDLYAWIIRGTRRTAIVKAMEKPMSPCQINKKSKEYNEKISLNNTSDTLRSFVRKGLATCLNGEAKTGRIYQLTLAGEEIREELMKG